MVEEVSEVAVVVLAAVVALVVDGDKVVLVVELALVGVEEVGAEDEVARKSQHLRRKTWMQNWMHIVK